MKKRVPLLLALVSSFSLAGGLTSCSRYDNPSNSSKVQGEEKEYVVKFNYNYEGKSQKVTVKSGEKVNLPANPTRPGYTFGGWYLGRFPPI